MRLVTYRDESGVHLGALRDDHVVVALDDVATDMLALIDSGTEGLARARAALERGTRTRQLAEVRLLAPILRPRQDVICLGMNYVAHAIESDRAKGREPKLDFDSAKGEVRAPLLLWGPYLWADGLKGRKTGSLVWKREDFAGDAAPNHQVVNVVDGHDDAPAAHLASDSGHFNLVGQDG